MNESLIDRFLIDKSAMKSSLNTRSAYERDLKDFAAYFRETDLDFKDIEVKHINQYFEALQKEQFNLPLQ